MMAGCRRGDRNGQVSAGRFALCALRFASIFLLFICYSALKTPAAAQTSASSPPASGITNVQTQVYFPPIDQRHPVTIDSFGGLMLFETEIGGRRAWGLFDNGFMQTVIDTGFAQSIGLDDDPQGARPRFGDLTTLGGKLPLKFVNGVDIKLPGQFSFRNSPQLSTDLSALSRLVGRPISLVIGQDLFDQFLFAFSVKERSFQMGQSGFRAPPQAIELNLKNNPPQIDVIINGHAATLTVDLGDNNFISLGDEAWSRFGLEQLAVTHSTNTAADGTISPSRTAIVDKLSVGPLVFTPMPVTRTSALPGQGDGRIGMGFFAGFNFVVDQKAHKIWLFPLSKPVDKPARDGESPKAGPKN
ncbi:pepsin/retropepsin-like aspartic protease family protein [Caulobacter sp. LARHSG274]